MYVVYRRDPVILSCMTSLYDLIRFYSMFLLIVLFSVEKTERRHENSHEILQPSVKVLKERIRLLCRNSGPTQFGKVFG